jgi:hypothetical protein
MNMIGTTPWYKSQAIWGGIQATIAGAITAWFAFRSGDLSSAAGALQAAAVGAAGVVASMGGINAIIGRARATTVIGPAPKV